MEKLVGWKPKSRDPHVASVRFRCFAPMQELQRGGFPGEFYSPERDAAGAYSAVIFSKLYGPDDQKIASSLLKRGVRVILDVCDNHFYNPLHLPEYSAAGEDLRRMARLADRVFCASPHLASLLSREIQLSRTPLVVGDAVEPMLLPKDARDPFDVPGGEPFRIVWFGSHGSPNAPSGMGDVARLVGHLERAQSVRPCELVIVSNNHKKFAELAPNFPLPSRYVEWSDTALMSEFARANLVVVPVAPNPFTKCKSNNRVATALWHGLPVLADRIPAYDEFNEFVFLDNWDVGFAQALAITREIRLRTAAGSAFSRTHCNIRAIGAEWRRAIKMVLAQTSRVSAA